MDIVMTAHLSVVLTVLILVGTAEIGLAQPVSDAAVRATVFGEAELASNARSFVRYVRSQPADQRFELLADWVFPGRTHLRLRLDSEFVRITDHDEYEQSVGANLLSPAALLVDLAKELGRLDELRQRLARSEETFRDTATAHDVRAYSAMQFLIELAAGNHEAARTSLGRLYDAFANSDHFLMDERWPETLAATRGIMHPETRAVAGELIDSMNLRLTGVVTRWRTKATPEWELHLRNLGGYRQRFSGRRDDDGIVLLSDSLSHWGVGVRESVSSLAGGFSGATWIRGIDEHSSEVRHVGGHWRDYLWFRSPLVGNYELECEVSGIAWHEVQLMAAGGWCGLKWDGWGVNSGTFRVTAEMQKLDERMANRGLWSRLRAVVRDGVCSTYFNGRRIHERSVTEADHPWVALRAGATSLGAFRDVRITGAPGILDRVNLIRDERLSGWSIPLEEAGRPDAAWVNADGELVGTRRSELDGTNYESLLSYCRPMLEDGELEFEFLYEPERVGVSPAIGRTVFLIDRTGVRLHRVTNGRFDRSDADPGNRGDVIGERIGLRSGEWNTGRLVLRGDLVTLEINGEAVLRHRLNRSEQRSFGLFHFADQTEARVRNIVWRGDWPKELPPVSGQELAAPEPECLDGLDGLKEVVAYQFSQGIPADDFELVGTIDVQPKDNGLLLTPPVKSSWSSGRFNWKQPIYGDFDIALKVSDLRQEYGNNGTLVVELAVVDDADTVVGCVRSRGAKDKANLVAKLSIKNPDGSRQYAGARIEDELEDGTLRIVRRGDEIHALASHGDSPNFRHVGSNRLISTLSPVRLQLVVASTGNGKTEVVFHELTIRSNSKAIEERIDPNVVAIDQYVAGFRQHFARDFATGGLEGFAVAGAPQLAAGQRGVVIRPQGEASQKPVTLTFDAPIEGEFDIGVSLNLSKLPVADDGEVPVELSLPLPGDSPESVSLCVSRISADSFRVEAKSKDVSRDQTSDAVDGSVIASVEVSSVEQLRVIRIQRSLLFVYSERGVGRLLGQMGCGDGDLAGGTVSIVTRLSPDAAASSEVRWLQFSVASFGTD